MSSAGKTGEPRVPTERPDPKAAARGPEAGAEDRPAFDLGGAKDRDGSGGMADPEGGAVLGADGLGRAGGLSAPGGLRAQDDAGHAGSAAGVGPAGGSGRR